jgi:alcohol dehydrogenase
MSLSFPKHITNFAFNTAPRLVCKVGAAQQIGQTLKKLGREKVLFVTDPGITKLGLMTDTVTAVKREGISVEIFDGVEPNPSNTTIEAAAARAKAVNADHIIGFGGGSPMDVAKLVACLACPSNTQTLDDMYGVDMIHGGRLPLTCVPTTAGTGSEVTMNSIVTVLKPGEEPIKKGAVSPQLLPDQAVLDAELTLGLPPHITADTGVDAMIHAIEAYTTRNKKNGMSDALAKEALSVLSRNLRTVVCTNPKDLEAREKVLYGSCMAGIAFNNAPVGAVHALAYPLGSHFHVTHGLSCTLMLQHVMNFNRQDPYGAGLYSELAPYLSEKLHRDGIGGANGSNSDNEATSAAVVREMLGLQVDCGMKTKLTEKGVKPDDLELLTSEAMKQTRLLPNNVREVTEADIRTIYTEAM